METNNIYYQLGMRDLVAQLFCQIRSDGVEETLRALTEVCPDNIHVIHYLNSLKEKGIL